MSETIICESKGKTYKSLRKNREHKRSYLIQTGSIRKRMICDCIETGLGLNHTEILLNKKLQREGLTEIGVLCLSNSYLRLNTVTVKIQKVLMGTNFVILLTL